MYHTKVVSYSMKMNRFGELTANEFRALMFGSHPKNPIKMGQAFYSFSSLTETPPRVDLRLRGMVTPVKDQMFCASGSTFAAVGLLEGTVFRQTSEFKSAQEAIKN